MKNILSLITILLISSNLLGQSTDFKTEITQKLCDCVNAKDIDQMSADDLETQFGICLINSIEGYDEELEKEFGEPFSMSKHSSKLGEMVGMKMVTVCPDIIQKLVEADEASTGAEETSNSKSVSGIVKKVNKGEFISFELETDSGTNTYHWLTEVNTNLNLKEDYKSLKKENVKIEYQVLPMFDPKKETYKDVNVITGIYKEE